MEDKQLFSFEGFEIATLQHYGARGQKWGTRNYRTYDGKLTESGKKRYAKKAVDSVKYLTGFGGLSSLDYERTDDVTTVGEFVVKSTIIGMKRTMDLVKKIAKTGINLLKVAVSAIGNLLSGTEDTKKDTKKDDKKNGMKKFTDSNYFVGLTVIGEFMGRSVKDI